MSDSLEITLVQAHERRTFVVSEVKDFIASRRVNRLLPWPVLAVDERVVDRHAGARSHDPFVSKPLDFGVIHIHSGSIDGFETDITANDLDV